MDRVTPAIQKVRAALAAGQRLDGRGPIDPASLVGLERSLRNTPLEHHAYQNAQARAHAMGRLSTEEALVIYTALGEHPASDGWAKGTDLATKVIVTQVMGELVSHADRVAAIRATR